MLTTKAGPFHPELAEPIRCVIVDDHEIVRAGLKQALGYLAQLLPVRLA